MSEDLSASHPAAASLTPPLTLPFTRSATRGATDVPLIEQPIGAFDAIAARQPDHEALVSVHQRRRYSYRELQVETDRLASALLSLGLQPGERVGIWSHNNAEWVLLQLATAKVGLILVNINPAYRTAEVEYALNKVNCKALVTMARFQDQRLPSACCANWRPVGTRAARPANPSRCRTFTASSGLTRPGRAGSKKSSRA